MPHDREIKGERSRSPAKKNVNRDNHRSSPTRKSRSPTRKGSSVRSVPVTSPPCRSTSATSTLLPTATSTLPPTATSTETVASMTASTERDEPIAEITLDGEDPRLNWGAPEPMETAASMEERIQAMVEKALSRVMASNATPVPSQSQGTVNLTGDGAEAGVRTRQKRGPEVGPPSSPLFTLRDGAEVGDHSQQKRGPEVGPPCSPLITLRDGAKVGDHTQQKRDPR